MQVTEFHNLKPSNKAGTIETVEFIGSIVYHNNFDIIYDLKNIYAYPYRGYIWQVFNHGTSDEFTANWQKIYTGRVHYPFVDLNKPFRLGFKVYKGSVSLKILKI